MNRTVLVIIHLAKMSSAISDNGGLEARENVLGLVTS